MKAKLAGFVEKKLNGRVIGFKFGTNAFALLSELHNVELDELDKVLGNVTGIRDLIFCAAQAWALSAGKEVWFNRYQVGDWLDEMSQVDYEDILGALNNAKVLGRSLEAGEKKV